MNSVSLRHSSPSILDCLCGSISYFLLYRQSKFLVFVILFIYHGCELGDYSGGHCVYLVIMLWLSSVIDHIWYSDHRPSFIGVVVLFVLDLFKVALPPVLSLIYKPFTFWLRKKSNKNATNYFCFPVSVKANIISTSTFVDQSL